MPEPSLPRPWPDARIQDLVGSRISALQARFLTGSQAATADLARLRRAVGRPVGSVPEVWELTIAGVSPPGGDGSPTLAETAVHIAMGLYAVHQRANSTRMHVPGVNLGRAVGRLSHLSGDSDMVSGGGAARRFGALATAVDISEAEYHLRGLVTMLSGAAVGLDYGGLAADLYRLQNPITADRVRLAWARAFYLPADPVAEATDPVPATATGKDAS